MLVLSRHREECIRIGDEVVITVVDIRGDKVRLGIDAPTHMPVHRQEVYEAIKRDAEKSDEPPASVRRDVAARSVLEWVNSSDDVPVGIREMAKEAMSL